MEIGISSFAFSWNIGVGDFILPHPMSFFDMVDYAVINNVKLLQIADNFPLDGFSIDKLEVMSNYASIKGVEIEIGTRGLTKKNMLEYFKIAKIFNSKILRVVIDKDSYEPNLEEIIRTINSFIVVIDSYDIKIAIENHDRFKSKELVKIIQICDDKRIGICLDTVNSFGALENLETVVDVLGPYVVNLHLKDFIIERTWHKMGFVISGAIAGKGLLDIPFILKKLKEFGRNPNAILEMWMPPENNIEKTAIKEKEWVKESILNLKQILQNNK